MFLIFLLYLPQKYTGPMISNILLITFSQGLIISLFLLANRNIRRSRYAYLLLMAFFLSLSIMQAWINLNHVRLPGPCPYIYAPWFFFLLPFMFMYVESLISVPKLSKRLLYVALFIFVFNTAFTYFMAEKYRDNPVFLKKFLTHWIEANEILGLLFSWFILWMIYYYYKSHKNLFHPYIKRWIVKSFYFANVIFILWALVIYGKYAGNLSEEKVYFFNEALHLASAFIVYWIIYAGIFHRMILDYNASNVWDNTKEIHLLNLIEHYQWYKDPHASLKKIADRLHISPHKLQRMVERHYQCGFDEYLTELRLEEAKRMMMQYPKASIYEIALMSGYLSPEIFRRDFKTSYGIDPENFMHNIHAPLA